jgi:hypothetical protein
MLLNTRLRRADRPCVGVEDRDWFREGSAERRRVSPSFTAGTVGVRPGAWLAIAVTAVTIAVTWQFDLLQLRMPSSDPPVAAKVVVPKVVRLGAAPGLDVPATVPKRWSVSGEWGTVDVLVPVGRTPREALTLALAERGFQVVE